MGHASKVPGFKQSNAETRITEPSKNKNKQDEANKLNKHAHTAFRGGAGMAQYMQDRRGDISFATKEVLGKASAPTGLDDQNLKKIARYIKGVHRCILDLPWAPMPEYLDVYVDSDWSGESDTRKSTSGGAACLGVELKHWCASQATVSLSSAEAENKAAVRGLIEGRYMTNVM